MVIGKAHVAGWLKLRVFVVLVKLALGDLLFSMPIPCVQFIVIVIYSMPTLCPSIWLSTICSWVYLT